MGHITRSIPIIHYLLGKGCVLYLVSGKKGIEIYRREFRLNEDIHYACLPSFSPFYFRGKFLLLSIFLQMPCFLYYYVRERQFVKKMEILLNFDAIISDNRYGFYSRKTTSLILCHQLILDKRENFLSKMINNMHAGLINNFYRCIVPDEKPWPDIAGNLSTEKSHIDPVYIGPLSRFYNKDKGEEDDFTELLILLSGQEPLRTRWERRIVHQLQRKKQKATIVGGSFYASHQVRKDGITYIPYSHADDLRKLIISAKHIICRAGYSTIMELLSLKKTAILVPTPGQPEQQYLASHLSQKGWFVNANEKNCLGKLPLLDNIKIPGHIDFNKFDELYAILF